MYQPLTDHNIMELWLFDTCNFRCGYCGLVANGAVADTAQLAPYREPAYVTRLLTFFEQQRPQGRPWAVLLTGGEPTLMPNLDAFVRGLGARGDTVALYSNLSIPIDKVLSAESLGYLSYLEASFHPDWHMGAFDADAFFRNVARVKELEIPVLVRFVGAPQLLSLLPELERRCAALGVSLLATTLFNPDYPRAYTSAERARLAAHMVGYSSLVQLDGGVAVAGRRCWAGQRIFAARLHQGGDITPCISTDKPVLGNIFQNTLRPLPGPNPCFRADAVCTCDIHFQQHIVEGVDDVEDFARILAGQGVKRAGDYASWKAVHRIQTSDRSWSGQGVLVHDRDELLRRNGKGARFVKSLSVLPEGS